MMRNEVKGAIDMKLLCISHPGEKESRAPNSIVEFNI